MIHDTRFSRHLKRLRSAGLIAYKTQRIWRSTGSLMRGGACASGCGDHMRLPGRCFFGANSSKNINTLCAARLAAMHAGTPHGRWSRAAPGRRARRAS